ncbi:MAG: hypothetical protein IPP48_02540 [Chitinophagaceae bacterium]|nr:hypothetical protein [Chitinophagaceae bacterium]
MKQILLFLFLSPVFNCYAQKQTFDIVTFTPPKGWKKEVKENSLELTNISGSKWAQIVIYKNTISKGNIDKDLKSEWETLVALQLKITAAPTTSNVKLEDGWKIKSGSAPFKFNNADAIALLTTFSGYGAMVSVLANTNSPDYMPTIQSFVDAIKLNNGKAEPVALNNQPGVVSKISSNFKFNTTNFDDGWNSTVQEDWVHVAKGNINVLIHYPKEGTIFPADPEPLTNAAWNILVAPRYSNLKNYKTSYINTYNRPYLGMGYATDNASSKQVFILLFRQGETGWLEFVAPDKNSFIQQFKFDPETIRWDSESDLLKPLAQMVNYNKFAIAENDFKGIWTSDFTGVQQLYHVYTGNYAGMNINQSNQTFKFGTANTYNWEILVVNGMVGSMKYANVKSSGKFTVLNNWQIKFSDVEGKPKKYNAFFSCIKGARLLHLLDAEFTGSGIYTVFGKK